MNEKNFIIDTLKLWSERFKGIILKYAYDDSIDFHIIEVQPESIRRGNDEYQKAEAQLWSDFAERFPDSDILITNPTEADDMSNTLYVSDSVNTNSNTSYRFGLHKSSYQPAINARKG